MSREVRVVRHQPVLVTQNSKSGNDLTVIASSAAECFKRNKTNPILLIFIGLMILVVVTNIAVLRAGGTAASNVVIAERTEKVQLAEIDANARIAIARSHYAAEAASHDRRAIFGGIVLAFIFLALVGALTGLKGKD